MNKGGITKRGTNGGLTERGTKLRGLSTKGLIKRGLKGAKMRAYW